MKKAIVSVLLFLIAPLITHADVTWYFPAGVDNDAYLSEMSSPYYNSGCHTIPSGNIQVNGTMGTMCDMSQYLVQPTSGNYQTWVDTSPNDHYINPQIEATTTQSVIVPQFTQQLIQGTSGPIPPTADGNATTTDEQAQIAELEQLIIQLTAVLAQLEATHIQ